MDEPGFYNGKHYTEYVDIVKDLKRQGRLEEAERLLLGLLDAVESEAQEKAWGVAPWYYEQLAIIYRKAKNLSAEIDVLERFAGQKHAPGVRSFNLLERLEKVKCRRDGKPYVRVPFSGRELDHEPSVTRKVGSPYIEKGLAVEISAQEPVGDPFGIGGCIDIETTGLRLDKDEIVEFAMVLFLFNRQTGEIMGILDEYTELREPSCPISREAAKIHGLTMKAVKGKRLDNSRIETMLARAELLVAHNAKFDRGFVVPLFEACANKPWYCSMDGINWLHKGFTSKGLHRLLQNHNIEIARSHRALDDAKAVVALLAQKDSEGKCYFLELLNHGPVIWKKKSAGKVATAATKHVKPTGCGAIILVAILVLVICVITLYQLF